MRNKAWKKTPTVCKSPKSKTKPRTSKGNLLLEKLKKSIQVLKDRRKRKQTESELTNVDKALRLSRKLQTIKAHTRKLHKARLT